MAGPPPKPGAPAKPGVDGAAATPNVLAGISVGRQRISTFTYTEDDVEAAAIDLMAHLPPPVPIASTGDKAAIGIVGPKGGKTVSSIAVKTDRCCGLPKPPGSVTVVMHLDNQAPNSFDNFLFASGAKLDAGEKLHFIGLGEPRGSYVGRPKRSDPAYSVYVRDVVLSVMRKIGERKDVGLLVFDGYGDLCNQYGGYVAAYESGVDSPLKLEGTQWYPRREMFSDLTTTGRSAVIPGGFFIVNGPDGGLESEREKEPAKLAKRLKKEGFVGRMPPAKWLMYRENNENLSVIVQTEVGFSDSGQPTYLATVWDGRLARIGLHTGAKLDISNENIGAFCDPANRPAAVP